MSFWTFMLLLIVFGGFGLAQLLNSETRAGALARAFASGLIEKMVGRREVAPTDDDSEPAKAGR